MRPFMADGNASQALWNQLVGEDLSGVVFVRDYLQLQFNPPPLVNVYSTRVTVAAGGLTARFGEERFANLIIGLIGRVVGEVAIVHGQFVRVSLVDGSMIEISLSAEDYRGSEAVEFQGRDGSWEVI